MNRRTVRLDPVAGGSRCSRAPTETYLARSKLLVTVRDAARWLPDCQIPRLAPEIRALH